MASFVAKARGVGEEGEHADLEVERRKWGGTEGVDAPPLGGRDARLCLTGTELSLASSGGLAAALDAGKVVEKVSFVSFSPLLAVPAPTDTEEGTDAPLATGSRPLS